LIIYLSVRLLSILPSAGDQRPEADKNTSITKRRSGDAKKQSSQCNYNDRDFSFGLFSAIGGSIIYRIIIAFALKIDLFPAYALKLISAAVVMAALSGPYLKKSLDHSYKMKQSKRKIRHKSSLARSNQ